eukprot:jgi/Picsp_1/4364/NSC_01870-R1_uv radiation resistance-associated gene protein
MKGSLSEVKKVGGKRLVSDLSNVSCQLHLAQRQGKVDGVESAVVSTSHGFFFSISMQKDDEGFQNLQENLVTGRQVLYRSEILIPCLSASRGAGYKGNGHIELEWQSVSRQDLFPYSMPWVRRQTRIVLGLHAVDPNQLPMMHGEGETRQIEFSGLECGVFQLSNDVETVELKDKFINETAVLLCSWSVDLWNFVQLGSYARDSRSEYDAMLCLEFQNGESVWFHNLPDSIHDTKEGPESTIDTADEEMMRLKELLQVCIKDSGSTYKYTADDQSSMSKFTPSKKPNSSLSRPLLLSQMKAHVLNLLGLQNKWKEAYIRSSAMEKICKAQSDRLIHIREKQNLLERLKESSTRLRHDRNRLERILKETTLQTAKAEKSAQIHCQAIVNTVQALIQASSKVKSGQESLQGTQGIGRAEDLSQLLTSRIHAMATEVCGIYRLMPKEVKVSRQSKTGKALLDAQLDFAWSGASQPPSAIQGYNNPPQSSVDQVASKTGPNMETIHHSEPSVEMIWTLGGMSLNSAVWKHAFDPEGYQWDPAADKAASIVLGYAAHIIQKLGEYFGVPLRYPILFRGSHSAILDNYPKAGTSQAAGSPVEYPLYCISNKERPKFAIAIFLLNKDVIQMLQYHSISSFGPNKLLQNLHALLAFSESSLPHGWKKPVWATTLPSS